MIERFDPSTFEHIPYKAARHPGATEPGSVERGANCEQFVHALLSRLGYDIDPTLRSYELWHDTQWTQRVVVPQPDDILFFNARSDPWGAHVGLHIGEDEEGEDQVYHLARHIGRPTIWTISDFYQFDKYKVFLGAKRPLKRR